LFFCFAAVRLFPGSAPHACQEVRIKTRDNVPVTVDAVVYFRVIDEAVCGRASGELPEKDFALFRRQRYVTRTFIYSATTFGHDGLFTREPGIVK
jgi:regulator of protease activity HflC (stomatin/prohibitin superfamily)